MINSAVWLGQGERKPLSVTSQESEEVVIETREKPTTAKETKPEILPPGQRVPEESRLDVEAEVKEEEISIVFGDRRYRIRGLDKNLSYDLLKINLLVSSDDQIHVDTFDLYSARDCGRISVTTARTGWCMSSGSSIAYHRT